MKRQYNILKYVYNYSMYNLNHIFSDKMTNCVNIVFSVFNYMNIADKSLQKIFSFLTTEMLEYASDWMDQD